VQQQKRSCKSQCVHTTTVAAGAGEQQLQQLGGRENYEEEEALGETNPAFRGVLGVFTPSIVTLPSLSSSYWLLTHCPSWSGVVVWTGNKIILGTVEVSDVVLWPGNKFFHLLSMCQTLISGNREWDTFTTCPSVKHISVNGEWDSFTYYSSGRRCGVNGEWEIFTYCLGLRRCSVNKEWDSCT
jgi:hypothetical protein